MMPAGLLLALALFADAPQAEPATAVSPPAADLTRQPVKVPDGCDPSKTSTDPRTINICAQKPDGYRINPDVLQAKRLKRSGGRPKPPERMVDKSCTAVGPMGCGPQAGINLIGAALTAAQMARRLSEGKEIGSMFVTDPTPSEYQLYQEAKRARESKEAEQAAKAKAKAVAAVPAQTVDPPEPAEAEADKRP